MDKPKSQKKEKKKLNLFQKLVEVRKTCEYLKKDRENRHFNYDYVSSSLITASLRKGLDDMGLLLVPSIRQANAETRSNSQGKPEIFTQVFIDFEWIDADNPEDRLKVPFYSQGIDAGERGIGKALTYGEKYFLLKFFNIATDKEDPDAFQNKVSTGTGANGPAKEKPITMDQPKNEDTMASPSEFGIPDGIGLGIRIKEGFASITEKQRGLAYKYKGIISQAGFSLHPKKKIYYKKIQ